VVERLERDGFVVIEGALDPGEVRRLTSSVDRVWRTEASDGSALHRLAFVPSDAAFLDLVDHPAALPVVTALLGWNIYLYHCHLDVHPRIRGSCAPAWRWHQDGGRQNVDLASPRPRLSIKVAYFLTDVQRAEDGAMLLIPGSHNRDVLERPPDGSVRPSGSEPLLVRAGTAVVMDRRLWHARGDNLSGPTRKVLFYAYTYRWIQPRDDLALSERDVAGLEPLRRQLLGEATSATGRWMPTDADVPLRSRAFG